MFITKRLYKIERAKFLLTIPHSDNSSPRYNRQHTDLEKNQTFPGLFSYHTKQRYSMLRIIKYFAFLFAFGRGMGIRLKASYMLGKQVPPPMELYPTLPNRSFGCLTGTSYSCTAAWAPSLEQLYGSFSTSGWVRMLWEASVHTDPVSRCAVLLKRCLQDDASGEAALTLEPFLIKCLLFCFRSTECYLCQLS